MKNRKPMTTTMTKIPLVIGALVLACASSITASNAVSQQQERADKDKVPETVTSTIKAPVRVTVPQVVLPLPGGLDDVPVFNSNSPEIVSHSGVLLSTFPSEGKTYPDAHLNYPLQGRFDIFFHHVAKKTDNPQTLYLALLAGNASSNSKTHLKISNAVSYRTIPDSPFKNLDSIIDNKKGKVYAGPGDRVTLDLLKHHRQHGWHRSVTLAPGKSKLISMLPLSSGRTGALRLESDGPVYLANLATFAKVDNSGSEIEPELDDWLELLNTQPLVEPRDKTPSVPGAKGPLVYGRVSGVHKGSSWLGLLTNDIDHSRLSIAPGQIFSFPISTIPGGTFGTNQVQAAPMLVRYPDTAYLAHGNYGVLYDLSVLAYNDSDRPSTVGFTLQTPLKDWNTKSSLQFFDPPAEHIFFRGTIKFEWIDDRRKKHKKFVHLVQKQGQQTAPLIELNLEPHEEREVKVSFLYPADCTPPQVLTVTSAATP